MDSLRIENNIKTKTHENLKYKFKFSWVL